MSTRSMRLLAALCLFMAWRTPAATLYVDLNSPGPLAPYATWATAATNIQDAVDASSPGDLVLVTNGIYATGGRVIPSFSLTNRVMVTNAITIESVNGSLATVIQGYQSTNIFGPGSVRCIYLSSGSLLIGFTLTDGASGGSFSEQVGGGILCASTNVVVSNCVITANASPNGGGVYSGTLVNCTLSSNFAFASDTGGGASAATLINCVLSGNTSGNGGGVFNCILTNCTLIGNFCSGSPGAAGATASTLNNCLLSNNSGGSGTGGAFNCVLNNCTITGNTGNSGSAASLGALNNCLIMNNTNNSGNRGPVNAAFLTNCTVIHNVGAFNAGGTVNCSNYNCIVSFNMSGTGTFLNTSNYNGSVFNYSCTAPLPAGGVGNISADPLLTDFHISGFSPCRGAGSSLYTSGTDIDGEAWLSPPSMGCEEFYGHGLLTVAIQADTMTLAPGFSANFTAQIAGSMASNKLDFGDGIILTNVFSASHAWATPGDYSVVFTAYNLDNPGSVSATIIIHVLAHPFQYVSLNSANPTSPYNSWATAATNIQDAVDVGFPGGTILVSNGVYQYGGRTVSTNQLTNRVVLTNGVTVQSVNGPAVTFIQGNQVAGSIDGPGAVRCAYLGNGSSLIGFTLSNGATFSSFVFPHQNDASAAGVWCDSTNENLINCVVCGNVAENLAGGVANGNLQGCLISNNIANAGGGVCGIPGGTASASRLSNCLLVSNSASQGGGADNALLFNCLIMGNSVTGTGGGVFNGFLESCTVCFNSASTDGGYFGTNAVNSIIWSNIASTDPNYQSFGFPFTNCCTTPLPPSGVGNITNDPLFVDFANGNFRLQSNSPCINAGNNLYVPTSLDLDGNPRIVGGTVDIGAYQFQNPTSQLSYAWLQQYNLPTDGSVDFADTDSDGMNNFQEWHAGTDPTNPNSRLLLLPPATSGTNLVVTWQSVSGINYYLQRSLGLTPASFQPLATNIVGQTGTTSYTDTNAPAPGPWFYRVGVQ